MNYILKINSCTILPDRNKYCYIVIAKISSDSHPMDGDIYQSSNGTYWLVHNTIDNETVKLINLMKKENIDYDDIGEVLYHKGNSFLQKKL